MNFGIYWINANIVRGKPLFLINNFNIAWWFDVYRGYLTSGVSQGNWAGFRHPACRIETD